MSGTWFSIALRKSELPEVFCCFEVFVYLSRVGGMYGYFLNALTGNNQFQAGGGENSSEVPGAALAAPGCFNLPRGNHFDTWQPFKFSDHEGGRFSKSSVSGTAWFWHKLVYVYYCSESGNKRGHQDVQSG